MDGYPKAEDSGVIRSYLHHLEVSGQHACKVPIIVADGTRPLVNSVTCADRGG